MREPVTYRSDIPRGFTLQTDDLKDRDVTESASIPSTLLLKEESPGTGLLYELLPEASSAATLPDLKEQ